MSKTATAAGIHGDVIYTTKELKALGFGELEIMRARRDGVTPRKIGRWHWYHGRDLIRWALEKAETVPPPASKETSEEMESESDLEELLSRCVESHEVGSRVTCDPPVLDTDRDILCLVEDWQAFVSEAARIGFEVGGSVPADEVDRAHSQRRFTPMRRGEDNLIITDAPEFAGRFMAATSIAKRLNLRVKSDRIALFQAVLYGNG